MFIHHFIAIILTLACGVLSAPAQAAADFQAPHPYDLMMLKNIGKSVKSHVTAGGFDPAGPVAKRTLGGARMSDGVNFTGKVWYGVNPLNTCIHLGYFAHNLLSFRPDEGTECYVMQGRCKGNDEFAEMHYNTTNIGNLGEYFWAKDVESYICIEE